MQSFTRLTLSLASLLILPLQAPAEFYTPERDQYEVEQPKANVEEELPKVLLIGDSITSGYFKQTRQLLAGEAQVFRNPGNAGETRNGLKKLDQWLGDTEWDVIHFNWGLHDLCYRHPESKVYGKRDKIRGTLSVSLEEYAENLEKLVVRLKQTEATLIFATITNIPDGEAGRFVGDDVRYNQAALVIMRTHGIAVNDLHALTRPFGPEMYDAPADVHFSEQGNARLAAQVVAAIRKHGLKRSATDERSHVVACFSRHIRALHPATVPRWLKHTATGERSPYFSNLTRVGSIASAHMR